ncbi:signal peptidase I [Pilibacter termitis]|uniref:Signal peptidase I n=1 Tax=Pilibacter termitis TaxID=263852 RepID=A0A1T4LRX6_9ENTE|nr:signal peptidase I [Pilibacter termitis]SJZ57366.1 signal peptidase I [Pilibacter termitis]
MEKWTTEEKRLYLKRLKKKQLMLQLKKERAKKERRKKIQRDVLLAFVVALFFFFICLFILYRPTVSSGYSMLPTVNDGELILANRFSNIRRYNLVLIREQQKNQLSIRRVIGLPNEKLEYRKDVLYINGQEHMEKYIASEIQKSKESDTQYTEDFSIENLTGKDTIPAGKYFVLGDNRSFAVDSRSYGFVDKKDILGVCQIDLSRICWIE